MHGDSIRNSYAPAAAMAFPPKADSRLLKLRENYHRPRIAAVQHLRQTYRKRRDVNKRSPGC